MGYVALDAAIKFSVLKVFNDSERTRRLSATGYVEWVLGEFAVQSAMHIITESVPSVEHLLHAILIVQSSRRVAFFDTTIQTVP